MDVCFVYRVFVVFRPRVKPTDVTCLRFTFQAVEQKRLYGCCRFRTYADLWLDRRSGKVFEESWGNHAPLVVGHMSVLDVSERCVNFWTMDDSEASFMSQGLKSLVGRGLSPQSEHWQTALSELMKERGAREPDWVRAN